MKLKPWFERVSIAGQHNSRWYSRRGARCGLGLALLAVSGVVVAAIEAVVWWRERQPRAH